MKFPKVLRRLMDAMTVSKYEGWPDHEGWREGESVIETFNSAHDFVEENKQAEAEAAKKVSQEPIPAFEATWDDLVRQGRLTGAGANVDTEWEEWVFPELEDEHLERIMKHLEEDSGEIRRR